MHLGFANAATAIVIIFVGCAEVGHANAKTSIKSRGALIGARNATIASPEDERLAVSRADFRKKIRGRRFEKWRDLKETLGPEAKLEPEAGGEVRLISGLSIAFVIILNVLIGFVISYCIYSLRDSSTRVIVWAVFSILSVYAVLVYLYCMWAYRYRSQRVVTNFLFGAVPLAVSAASYTLAILVLDLVRSHKSQGGLGSDTFVLDPWQEHLDGRIIFFLAVLPGLATSIYLGNTVSTGFKAVSTHFDVLSLCLYIDVARFVGHLSYVCAPHWSIGKARDSISSRPGLLYVFLCLCIAWFIGLARLEAGSSEFLIEDSTKITTLLILNCFAFFPLALWLSTFNIEEFFELFEQSHPNWKSCAHLVSVSIIALIMLAIAIIFNAVEPNLMGIGALIWVTLYGSFKLSNGHYLGFILAMIPFLAGTFLLILVSTHYAKTVREALLAALTAW